MMQAIAESGAGFSGASAVHMNIFGLNPVVVFGNDEQKRRMLPPLIEGKHKRLLRRHRAEHRPEHQKPEGEGREAERKILRVRPEGLDLHRAGRREGPAARASGSGPHALLHRRRPQVHRGARDREDGPPRGRLEPGVLRRAAGARGRPHRRGGQGLRVHPARHEPGAHPDRRRAGRPGPLRGEARRRSTRRSASSSTGRSARTRRSSTRSPPTGWRSRPPT